MLKNKRYLIYFFPLMSAVISLTLGILIMAISQITPFGNNNLLISDMGSQYIAFFSSLHHALFTHSFGFYSFSQSLGANFFPTIAYYLISPFNLLLLFFPSAAAIPKAVTLIIILKSAASAFTMNYFLEKHFKQQNIMLAILSTIFSLNGFVALNYFNIMWLDSLIWLPLVVNGIDILVSTGRSRNFFGWLFISILTNFYLGYMTCLFSCFYLCYILDESKLPMQHFWKSNSETFIRFISSELLCALSTAFLLLPTALGMLQTAKGSSWKDFTIAPQFGFEVLSQLGVGASNYSSRLAHAPSIFCTSFVILLAFCFFIHPQIKHSSKKHSAYLLLALLVSMLLKLSNTIWHLGQQPAGFPFRNSFFVIFILLIFAYQAWQKAPHKISFFWKLMIPCMTAGAIVSGYLGSHLTLWFIHKFFSNQLITQQLPHTTPLISAALSIIFIALTSFFIFPQKSFHRKSWLVLIIFFEITCNFYLAMKGTPFGNQTIYQKSFTRELRQTQRITRSSNELFRISNTNSLINKAYREEYYNYNDPMLFNFFGINFYSSTLSEATRESLHSLGFFSKNVRRISSLGLTPVTEFLFGIKYSFELNNKLQDIKPNYSFAGIGFTVPTSFKNLTLDTRKNADPLLNLETILQSLTKNKGPYFKETTLLSTQKSYKQTYSGTSGYTKYTLTMQNKNAGPLYFDYLTRNSSYGTIHVNGNKLPLSKETNQHRYLRYLGTFPKNSSIKVSFTASGDTAVKRLHFYSLDEAKFRTIVAQARKNNFTPAISNHWGQTKVNGSINVTKHQSKNLYLSIPYDKGWSVLRNGHRVAPKRVLKSMMMIKLTHGHNKISLTYHVPGLKLGSVLSLISVVLYYFMEFYPRSKKIPEKKQRISSK